MRYKRSLNPAWVAGMEVDYRSGFGARNITTVKIDRVTKNGNYFYVSFPAAIPGNPPRVVKFRVTHNDWAEEVTDSRYGAMVHMRTPKYLEQRAKNDAAYLVTQRRKELARDLRDLSVYALSEADMASLEAMVAKYKAALVEQ